ncbi:MAG TPA: PspC domain-containing protein [Gaiellaceae bacterium]|nr:PspC domain-containing protein [Gaiellaceae bacterium]
MSEHITQTQGIKRLERSSTDRLLAGVSGGLGRYFDLNPAVFRIGFVVLTLLGGAGILAYLVAVLVIPEEGAEQSTAERVLAERRNRPWPLIGLGLVAAAILVLLSRGALWPVGGAGWVLVLLAGLAILWTYDARRGDARSRRLIAVLLSVVVAFFAIVVAAIVTAFAWFDVSLSDGVGNRTYAPATSSDVKRTYSLGVGDLRVDLSNVTTTNRMRVRAKLGVGELHVIVPRNAEVTVDAHAKAGDVHVLDQQESGRNVTVQTGRGGALTIVANVGAGAIDVVRAGD